MVSTYFRPSCVCPCRVDCRSSRVKLFRIAKAMEVNRRSVWSEIPYSWGIRRPNMWRLDELFSLPSLLMISRENVLQMVARRSSISARSAARLFSQHQQLNRRKLRDEMPRSWDEKNNNEKREYQQTEDRELLTQMEAFECLLAYIHYGSISSSVSWNSWINKLTQPDRLGLKK